MKADRGSLQVQLAEAAVDAKDADDRARTPELGRRIERGPAHRGIDEQLGIALLEVIGEEHLVARVLREITQVVREPTFALDRDAPGAAARGWWPGVVIAVGAVLRVL